MDSPVSKQKHEPRKHNTTPQSPSVLQLEKLPLKKRLEILFTVNIIPSRRQLAIKYGLDEQIIHNVLSHRAYLLQNWKYNSDSKRLLTKQELEKAKAMMELLLEWKRRVQLNGLQMTDAALLRKAKMIKKILNAFSLDLTEDWRSLFEDNWQNKHFHDNDNESLELEDILNDLQWMFTERTFSRFLDYFKRAKSAARGVKREKHKSLHCNEEEQEANEGNDPLDVSEIEIEPDYYNDDDFECEDFEHVLDEEFIMDSLRKELADDEAASYQQFMFGDDMQLENVQDEELHEEAEILETANAVDTEHFLEENVDNDDLEIKCDNIDFQIEPEKSISPTRHSTPSPVPIPVLLEPANLTESLHKPMQTINPISNVNMVLPAPKPFRRKPRDMHTKLTVRKDSVRLPGTAEIANLVKIKFTTEQRNEEDNNEIFENDDTITDNELTPTKRKNKQNLNTKVESIQQTINSPKINKLTSLSLNNKNNEVNHSNEEESNISDNIDINQTNNSPPTYNTEEFHQIKKEIYTHQHSDVEELKTEKIINEPNCQFEDHNTLSHLKDKNVSLSQNVRRSKRFTSKNDLEKDNNIVELKRTNSNNTANDNEFILGGPANYNTKINNSTLIVEKKSDDIQSTVAGRRKNRSKNTLKVTSIKIIPSPSPIVSSTNFSSLENPPINQKTNYEIPALVSQNIFTNVAKRLKRRTDGADLTLRRDKVRISQAPVADQQHLLNAQETSIDEIDQEVNEMIVEPYDGEG